MLRELKQFLSRTKVANLISLAEHLQVEPLIVKDMLGHFLRKGVVRLAPAGGGCQSRCTQCDPMITQIYEWVG